MRNYNHTIRATLLVFSASAAAENAAPLTWLRTRGTQIVDETGKTVHLRGTNFGSWLLIEPWIPSFMPRYDGDQLEREVIRAAEKIGHQAEARQVFAEFKQKERMDPEHQAEAYIERFRELAGVVAATRLSLDVMGQMGIADEVRLWKVLERRFSMAQVQELKDTFRGRWITEQDVANLKKANMNMVRVPFFYQLLEDDNRPGEYKPDGWRWLDALVGWCRRHGIYALIDMHGAPGGQNDAGHSGVAMRNALWTKADCQDRTEAMWVAIAKRYANEPAVLGYDLMNEPWGAPTPKVLHDFHDRLYKAIRKVDPRHIIVMEEGYKQLWTFPSPARRGWENVMYSLHFYLPEDRGVLPFEMLAKHLMPQWHLLMRSYNVPLFVGEFSSQSESGGGAQAMAIAFREMNRFGFHWAPWTYKKVDMNPPPSLWGLYHWPDKWPGVPTVSGTFGEIREALQRYDTSNFVPHQGYLKAFLDYGVSAGGAEARMLSELDARIDKSMPRFRRILGRTLTEEEAIKALDACAAAADVFRAAGGSGEDFLEMGPFCFELGGRLPPAAEEKLIEAFGSIDAFSAVWMRLSMGIWFVPRGKADATNIDAELTVTPETVQLLTRLKPRIDRTAAKIAGGKAQFIDVTAP
jgi:endoglucanase